MKSLATSARTAEVENLLVAAHFLLGLMLIFSKQMPEIALLDCQILPALSKNEDDSILSCWHGSNFDGDGPQKEPNILLLFFSNFSNRNSYYQKFLFFKERI